jgi:pyruvate dehydrogenase E1 component alpha subunit
MITDDHDPLKGRMFQILDKDGNLVGPDPGYDETLLKAMYWWMTLARMADDKSLKLQRQGRMGTYAPIKGQEAAQVGSALAMVRDDWMFPAFRELGAYMVRGVTLEHNLLYFMGDVRGNAVPEGIHNLPIYVPVGTQLPQAVGAAHAMRLAKKPTAVLAFLGDGATSTGDFHEGLNLAGVLKAPVVFLCQNNGWAISVPRSRQSAAKTIAQKAVAYGFPGVQVDGNDVLAVYATTYEALERARLGEGPTLIEAVTYRLLMHTTADGEQQKWEARDPIKRFRAYLERKGIWTEQWQHELEERATKEISEAIAKAESIAPHVPEHLFENMYAEMPEELKEQLEYLKRSLETKEIDDDADQIQGGFP